jgi:pantoate--beta-alanine ligase
MSSHTQRMQQLVTIPEMRAWVADTRRRGERVALVPTMGALHDGHLSLVDVARQHADRVVVSVFVNPLQFAPTEDLARYPRDLAGDVAKATERGVDVLWLPEGTEIYPHEPRVLVRPGALAERWEGAARPGHFAGMLTVVLKLLNVVQPDVAVFGQKDVQQAALVRAMVEDLNVPVQLVVAPIVRDADGLALSSRNRYLANGDRRDALTLRAGLRAMCDAFAGGERDATALVGLGRLAFDAAPNVSIDYLAVVDPGTLEPVSHAERGSVALVAARVGATRLLDNAILGGA